MHVKFSLTLLICSSILSGCAMNSGLLALADRPAGAIAASSAREQRVHLVTAQVVNRKFGRQLHELPSIKVSITNRGTEAFDVSTANIEAMADSTPVKVYSTHEYISLVRNNVQLEQLSAQARANGAAIRSSWGMGPASVPQISGKIDKVAQLSEARQKGWRLIASAKEMLNPRKVAPAETLEGEIRLQAGPILSARQLHVRMTVGSELHEFHFSVTR